jgi:hypothetical protein
LACLRPDRATGTPPTSAKATPSRWVKMDQHPHVQVSLRRKWLTGSGHRYRILHTSCYIKGHDHSDDGLPAVEVPCLFFTQGCSPVCENALLSGESLFKNNDSNKTTFFRVSLSIRGVEAAYFLIVAGTDFPTTSTNQIS